MVARCYRDDYAIPHLIADTLTELGWAQGYECARSRCWQLDYQHRRGLGTTAELFGPPALDWDRLARRVGFADLAEEIFGGLDVETQDLLSAYADGVNAGFDDLARELGPAGPSTEHADLAAAPLPWQPWTPITGFVAIHFLFGRVGDKLWGGLIDGRLGREAVRLFNAEGPADLSGSNAMVLGGDLTASGRPLIAGDSHRTFEDPNPYYQVRLAVPGDFDTLGFAFPGVPGVLHFGHTGGVAWAVTNAVADTHDVFLERLEPDAPRRTETVEVRDAAPADVEIVSARTGPAILIGAEAGLPPDSAFTALTPPLTARRAGFEAIVPLLRARTVSDVAAAFESWVEPANNLVIADSAGALTHRVVGLVPEREQDNWLVPGSPESTWRGWVDPLPRHDLDAGDRFVTANDRASDDYDRIGGDFAGPWRADRIRQLLDAAPGPHDADSLLSILLDDRQTEGDTLLTAIAALDGLTPAGRRLQRDLGVWDRTMAADSVPAARFISVRDALARRLAAQPAFDGLRDRDVFGDVFAVPCDLTGRLALCLPAFMSRAGLAGIEIEPLLSEALEQVAEKSQDDTTAWGSRHLFAPLHAFDLHGRERAPAIPATPLPSDRRCVRAVASAVGSGAASFGSVTRYVWDLADRQQSRWAVPLGAAGRADSPHHHDQLELWAGDSLAPVVTDLDRLALEAEWECGEPG